jgi:hypothetical protein
VKSASGLLVGAWSNDRAHNLFLRGSVIKPCNKIRLQHIRIQKLAGTPYRPFSLAINIRPMRYNAREPMKFTPTNFDAFAGRSVSRLKLTLGFADYQEKLYLTKLLILVMIVLTSEKEELEKCNHYV